MQQQKPPKDEGQLSTVKPVTTEITAIEVSKRAEEIEQEQNHLMEQKRTMVLDFSEKMLALGRIRLGQKDYLQAMDISRQVLQWCNPQVFQTAGVDHRARVWRTNIGALEVMAQVCCQLGRKQACDQLIKEIRMSDEENLVARELEARLSDASK